MKRIIIISILFHLTFGFVFSQNRSDKRGIKKALKSIKLDSKAMTKLGIQTTDITLKLQQYTLYGFIPDNCSYCVLENILLNRVYNNLTLIKSKLLYTKLKKKRLFEVIKQYKILGITTP